MPEDPSRPPLVGVLALQGAFREHLAADETGAKAPLADSGGAGGSTTLMKPPGRSMESRITDEADALEKEHSAS